MTNEQMKTLEARVEKALSRSLPNGVERGNTGVQISDRQWDLIASNRLDQEGVADTDALSDLSIKAEEEFGVLAQELSELTELNWLVFFPVVPTMTDQAGEDHYFPCGLKSDG